jgi:hypothetical protein
METGKWGWLALGAFYLIFEILVPLLKKRAAKQRQLGQSSQFGQPQVVPQPTPARSTPQLRVPAQRRRPPIPRPSSPEATRPTAASTGVQVATLTREAYHPFLSLPGVAPVVQLEGFDGKISAAASRPDYPVSLDLLHQGLVTTVLHRVPGLRADAVAASGLKHSVDEIRSIEELVQASDRLAVGWLDTAFVDAVGMAIFGSPYALLRFQRLATIGRTHTLTLQNTGSRAMSVVPPLRVLGPAMVGAAATLNLRANGFDLRARLDELGALDGQVRLKVSGFGRDINFDLDPRPAIDATTRMVTGILKERFQAFGDESLFELSMSNGVGRAEKQAAMAANGLLENDRAVDSTGLSLLQTLLLVAHRLPPARLRAIADGGGGRIRGSVQEPEKLGITASPAALVEAIIFGEILTRQRGR